MVIVNFSNGACLAVETSSTSHIKEDTMYLELLGTKGGITVDPKLEIHTEIFDYLMDIVPRINCTAFDFQVAADAEIRHLSDLG